MRKLTLDAIARKNKFKTSNSAEKEFFRALKQLAKNASHIVDAHAEGASLKDPERMMKVLSEYSEAITPWAVRQAEKMLEAVQKSNKRAWAIQSQKMSRELKEGVAARETGQTARLLLNEQVALIKSIPLEAGLRAQKIAEENFFEGRRAVPDQSVIDQLVNEMGMTEEVAVNRARLIARTETAKANASILQARATSLGVTSYVWRTTMDGAERESHAEMNGEVVEYAHPPTLSDGMTGHAGNFPNCRCWQDPIIPGIDSD